MVDASRSAAGASLSDRPPPRTLVVAPSWVGDAVLSQPLLARLSGTSPGLPVDVLAPSWCAAVYERMSAVAEIVVSPFGHAELRLGDRWRLARTLKARGYDRAYVLPNSLKSALVPWLAGIRARIGYVGEQRGLLLTDARRLDPHALPRLVDRFAARAFPSGVRATEIPRPRLEVDPERRRETARRLELPTDRPVVALCPGAEYGPAKRWPAPYFADLARRFVGAGCAVWLFGSGNDAEAAGEIATRSPRVRNLVGRTRLGEAIDLLSFASRVVTNDSGLMHVAAALDRPMIAIFGSSSPDYTPPLSDRARIARLALDCSPCFARTCPLGHTRCLRELGPDQVYAMAQSLPAAA